MPYYVHQRCSKIFVEQMREKRGKCTLASKHKEKLDARNQNISRTRWDALSLETLKIATQHGMMKKF